MQSTNVRQIKAAIRDQAFHGTTQVSCRLSASGRGQLVEGATPRDDPWMGSLVPGGECTH